MPLNILSHLPGGLLDCAAHELEARLGGPTLIHLDGHAEPALFVSVLLHGNETSGWQGLRRYLAQTPELPRSLTIFIGNVAAAARDQRALPDQQDFNRIWRRATGAGAALADALTAALAGQSFFAAVDLHNNTGHNPFYSVVMGLEEPNLGLAYLFSQQAVLVEEPDTTLTGFFEGRCPAVALEVGPVGDPRCDDRVFDFLQRIMALEEIEPVSLHDLQLYRALARVHVRPDVDFSFAGENESAPLVLTGGVEAVNFHELARGTRFASSPLNMVDVLQVLDPTHQDVTGQFFQQADGEIVLSRALVPAMYTTDPYVIRQDCLCYFMQRYER